MYFFFEIIYNFWKYYINIKIIFKLNNKNVFKIIIKNIKYYKNFNIKKIGKKKIYQF